MTDYPWGLESGKISSSALSENSENTVWEVLSTQLCPLLAMKTGVFTFLLSNDTA